ncbi:MAG: MBL fold metallo-hydrolase [Proteobacteria bacterium]|jgi:glyoxylase-like metal-dependent hydrolase (beta-lactamase superfamily II)|nr:MBL fold metallo-hydrolase [Desulfocapsa sp.]MBU3943201.1 MBL fold metallo-hydrolase [Pseudomonadota bacterium]MCG2744859.1 MBL fold metallo-hydrolase [Desulfobacteraceae bacterium]MBU4028993.1 MBL fold metallo-hydrolase [Pseudomonadota bacterium]MBU4043367.1 MBL fold metallo-hydrolase [Pseudomonadota bacterium]
MQVTERIHAIKIPFKIPVSPEISIDRFAFVYLVFGDKIHLIDSGVAGTELTIWEYIKEQGRDPKEVSSLILTHSHPDHIGSAKSVKSRTDCTVFAHKLEQEWIENTEQQFKDRPVPGFQTLVEGPVVVDRFLAGGEILELEKGLSCKIIHTPGHSKGSISLLFEDEKTLFTADALAYPGDLPIYEDIFSCLASIRILQHVENVDNLLSSWEGPIQGQEEIIKRMNESIVYLERIHTAVMNNILVNKLQNIMELCQKVVSELGLPPFAAMPLVAKALASSLVAEQN